MTFQSVFRSLHEVFPQIDLRILKAAAFEHAEDVDAAVEFILSDVLPNEMEDLSAEVGPSKQAIPVELEEVDEVNMTTFTEGDLVRRKRASARHTSADVNSSGMMEAVDEGSQVGYAGDPKEPGFFVPHYGSSDANFYPSPHPLPNLVDNITGVASDLKNGALHLDNFLYKTMVDSGLSDVHNENNADQLTSNPKIEQDSLGEHFQFCEKVAENVNDDELHAEKSIAPVDTNDKNPLSANVENLDLMEYGASVEVDINHYVSESEVQQSQCSVEPARSQDLSGLEANDTASSTFISGQDILPTVCDESSDSMDCRAEVQKGTGNNSSECEEQRSRCLSKNSALLAVESQLPSADDNHQPSTLATRSGHLVSIEFLEEFITDAKSSKKNLLSAKELVTNLMKEVEFLEERAKQTKEEALISGQDILLKVEELRQMLKHAKEANDMHAGEVYGEWAILATEARELQSRLFSLSNEQNKSLSVIEEIHQTLEARRCAAEQEMAAAEQEKLEREERAHKAFSEQELIMDTIVGESKKLRQEAEENSRLREFLMDRGLIVDALQGEIAVIWEDVLLLKERVDGRIPPSKSQRSSISCSTSSSSSSCHESIHSLDRILHHVESADQDSSKRQQRENSNTNDKENYVGRNLSVRYHDDWAFFEFEA